MRTANVCVMRRGHLKGKVARGGSWPLLLNKYVTPNDPTRTVLVLKTPLPYNKDNLQLSIEALVILLVILGRYIVHE